jgi:putative endonuclease
MFNIKVRRKEVIVYILYSKVIDRYYVGSTTNIEERLRRHNSNHKGFTGKANDWYVVHQENYDEKQEAKNREVQIKSWKSRKSIEALINRI